LLENLKGTKHEALINLIKSLDEGLQKQVLNDINVIDLDKVDKMYKEVYVKRDEYLANKKTNYENISFVDKSELSDAERNELYDIGIKAIEEGKVAQLLMAGGQGTRLQHPGPKGTFEFDGLSLFEMQANQLKALNKETATIIPWYIMTSDINHEETIDFFETNNYFDYDKDSIYFFKQDLAPSLSKDGSLLIDEDYHIMETPNGNGGIYHSFDKSGGLDHLIEQGYEYLFLNNIDNVLVKVMDPYLIGLAVKNESDVTSKTIEPLRGESVGRLVSINGKHEVVEYTELPDGEESEYTNANLGIHVFKLSFLKCANKSDLPYHLAIKKLNFMQLSGEFSKEEALKFEKFYFDIFSQATQFSALRVGRDSEFAPLKNKEGKDSIATARKMLENNGIL